MPKNDFLKHKVKFTSDIILPTFLFPPLLHSHGLCINKRCSRCIYSTGRAVFTVQTVTQSTRMLVHFHGTWLKLLRKNKTEQTS